MMLLQHLNNFTRTFNELKNCGPFLDERSAAIVAVGMMIVEAIDGVTSEIADVAKELHEK